MLPFVSASMIVSGIAPGSPGGVPIQFNGAFTTYNPSSVVDSPELTATVDGGGSGSVSVQSFFLNGSVVLYADVNSGGFNRIYEDDSITISNGQTLIFRITGVGPGDSLDFDLIDDATGIRIEAVTLAYG